MVITILKTQRPLLAPKSLSADESKIKELKAQGKENVAGNPDQFLPFIPDQKVIARFVNHERRNLATSSKVMRRCLFSFYA